MSREDSDPQLTSRLHEFVVTEDVSPDVLAEQFRAFVRATQADQRMLLSEIKKVREALKLARTIKRILIAALVASLTAFGSVVGFIWVKGRDAGAAEAEVRYFHKTLDQHELAITQLRALLFRQGDSP